MAFEDAGEHVLKGKAEPARLWRAGRVLAGVRRRAARRRAGGAVRRAGTRELRLVKELFHASAEQRPRAAGRGLRDRRGRQVAAGLGVRASTSTGSREDGLVAPRPLPVLRRGRGLLGAGGDGAQRARIAEGEDAGRGARQARGDGLAEHVPDAEERALDRPAAGRLLGLEERADTDRQELFAGWRLFFERLADESPVVLLFEDLQYADAALLDFLDHLVEWSQLAAASSCWRWRGRSSPSSSPGSAAACATDQPRPRPA